MHLNNYKPFFLLIFIFAINSTAFAQNNSKINVTFFGSSVCKGSGAEDNHGYAWQFFHKGAIDTSKYRYYNASTGGDNTIKVEREDRITKNLNPTKPNIVVIGLSLANEGIMSQRDENGREQILEQFRSRLLAMADSFNRQGIKPVIVNCYAQSYFSLKDYEYTKRMNREINKWKYPSINVLGTIDDGNGKWVEGYAKDSGHPNTKGHKEMSYSIVPGLFDAIELGKETPTYDWNRSFTTLVNNNKREKPLSIDLENTVHSFTMSFRFKKTEDGSIAGFNSENKNQSIWVEGHKIQYKNLFVNFPKHLNGWTHIVLAHSYSSQKTNLYINGKLVGTVDEQISPSQIYFGGTTTSIEFKDLTLIRSCINEDEALDLFNKKFIQSSLEFYSPMTKPIKGKILENKAQSLTDMKVDKQVELEFNKLIF